MESMKKEKTIEEIKQLIVNHPVKAYMEIGVDLMGAINDNSGIMLMCIEGIFKGAVIILKNIWLLASCILSAIKHLIFLAFYPAMKLYFVVGARREILRENPEYRQPRQKDQKR